MVISMAQAPAWQDFLCPVCQVQISDGIDSGQVVTLGQQLLKDGSEVSASVVDEASSGS